jgi:hypothetical protein
MHRELHKPTIHSPFLVSLWLLPSMGLARCFWWVASWEHRLALYLDAARQLQMKEYVEWSKQWMPCDHFPLSPVLFKRVLYHMLRKQSECEVLAYAATHPLTKNRMPPSPYLDKHPRWWIWLLGMSGVLLLGLEYSLPRLRASHKLTLLVGTWYEQLGKENHAALVTELTDYPDSLYILLLTFLTE